MPKKSKPESTETKPANDVEIEKTGDAPTEAQEAEHAAALADFATGAADTSTGEKTAPEVLDEPVIPASAPVGNLINVAPTLAPEVIDDVKAALSADDLAKVRADLDEHAPLSAEELAALDSAVAGDFSDVEVREMASAVANDRNFFEMAKETSDFVKTWNPTHRIATDNSVFPVMVRGSDAFTFDEWINGVGEKPSPSASIQVTRDAEERETWTRDGSPLDGRIGTITQ